jgi:hypothetical protein
MTAAFSRSGNSNPLGKCTEELKTKVPEAVKVDLSLAARQSHTPVTAEYLRDVVMRHLYGAVEPDMQDIVWEHVCKETESPLLLKMLHEMVYGKLHEPSVELELGGIQASNRASKGAGHAH